MNALSPVATNMNSTAAPIGTTANNNTAISSDFETFLRMLTVQVQNQDPLNPVDSTDYATQLATFSSVEQQVLTNDLLKDMAQQLGGDVLQKMSGWVGMDALVRAPVLFDVEPITLRPDYAEGADSAILLVRNSAGDVVQRFDLDPSQDSVMWAGVDEAGNLLPADVYRFEVESYEGETLLGSTLAPAYNRVMEVRSDDGELTLRLSDGSEIPTTMVTGVRNPS